MADTTDTPISTNTIPRPPRLDQIKSFVGDLARPIAIIGTTYGFNRALISVADRLGPDATAAAIFITASGGILAALYGAKSWEMVQSGKQSAGVEIAKATTPAVPRDDTAAP